MRRFSLPALAGFVFAIVSAMTIASGTEALAQASPSPSPSAASTAPAPSSASPAPGPKPSSASTSSPSTVPGAAQPAATAPKPAEDFLSRFTVNVAPGFFFASNSDAATGPSPDRTTHLGFNTSRRNADVLRFDYGADFKITPQTHLSFSHGNVAYQLGRILINPGVELETGELVDYTDTYSLSHTLGGGLGVHATYFNHQRAFGPDAVQPNGSLFCLNAKSCGGKTNPLSVNEHGYTFGAGYDFGPTSKIGKILSAAFDVKYVPRGPNPVAPGVALGDLGAYVGSQVIFPYSLTLKLPVTDSATFIPFVNYTNLPVLYADSAVPEAYRGIVFGFVKIINKNATLSYTNLNLQSCRCITRVPPPDNLRLALGILKLDFHTQL